MRAVKTTVPRTPVVGRPAYAALHGVKRGLKDLLAPQAMFEDLGLKYVGPIDGHDEGAVEEALRQARAFGGPVLVHCLTHKGHGYAPAENDEADNFHGVSVIDPHTGIPIGVAPPSWTQVFAEEMVAIGHERPDVVGITAAMLRPVGLHPFAQAFPERVFDVGIAEQHAVTSAAGLALGGLHPVVCVYATFLNRAFDQVLLDVAMHRQPVTFVLDRAGVTGDDGASHHGMWDLAMLGVVPGMRVAAPRDATRLRELLREAVADGTGPTTVRFPKAQTGREIGAVGRVGRADVLRAHVDARVLVVAVGPLADVALAAADLAADAGVAVTVVDPRWVLPVEPALVELAAAYDVVVTVEDGVVVGGVGDAIARQLRARGSSARLVTMGLPRRFVPHGRRAEILAEAGLDAPGIAAAVLSAAGEVDVAVAQPNRRASVR
jgi:1-deoxy-D-xylulose-5-phosphate synthase